MAQVTEVEKCQRPCCGHDKTSHFRDDNILDDDGTYTTAFLRCSAAFCICGRYAKRVPVTRP